MKGKSIFYMFGCILIVLLGAGIAAWFMQNRPRAPQKTSQKEVPRVYVHKAEQVSQRIRIQAMGEVLPASEVALKPRVSGQVTRVFDDFRLGKVVQKEEKLLKIDPEDYKLALRQQRSQLSSALADLELERGEQGVAKSEWDMLSNRSKVEDPDLALRKPQLRKAKAKVRRLRAALDKARLDLERTLMRAPFHGLVTKKSVYKGSEIGSQKSIATLVGIERYWVRASIPLDRLPWIEFAERDGKGSKAKIISKSRNSSWQGRVLRVLGDLEKKSRMARVLVEVKDPVVRKDEESFQPLLLNSCVRLQIKDKRIADAIKVPSSAMHEGDKVWVASDKGRLDIRKVDVLWRNQENTFIRSGL